MLNQTNPTARRDCASWAAAQLAELHSLVDAIRSVIAMPLCAELYANRHVWSARRWPHIKDIADQIESIFAVTSPYHLGTAGSAAINMQRLLDHAIASVSERPESEVVKGRRLGHLKT